MANKKTLTREEIERIKSLEVHTYNVAGKPRRGYFDSETLMFYLMDDKGELTGEVGQGAPKKQKVPTPDILRDPRDAEDEDIPDDGAAEEKEESKRKRKREREPKEPKEKKRRKKDAETLADSEPEDEESSGSKKGKVAFFIIAGLVCAAVAIVMLLPTLRESFSDINRPSVNTYDQQPETVVRTAVTPEQVGNVVVLAAKSDMYKGDIITADKLEYDSISNAEYNQLLADGSYPCKKDEQSYVEGMYVTTFISKGQYILDTSVSSDNPVTKNPWEDLGSDYSLVTIPASNVDDGSHVSLGALGGLEIVQNIAIVDDEEGTSEDGAEGEESGEGEGEYVEEETWEESSEDEWSEGEEGEGESEEVPVEIEEIEGFTASEAVTQSLIVRNYAIEKAVVVDLLNSEGSSVYPYCAQYLDIPSIKLDALLNSLRESVDFRNATDVSYVVVAIGKAQADAVGDLDNCEIKMTTNGSLDTSNESRSSIAKQFSAFIAKLYSPTVTVAEETTAPVEEEPVVNDTGAMPSEGAENTEGTETESNDESGEVEGDGEYVEGEEYSEEYTEGNEGE